MLSALTGDGVGDLKSYLAEAVPPGPWLFPEDQLTDASLRQSAAEITREKLFLRLHDELPYTLTVETADWKELADGSIRIEQTIYVERESQRKIVLGAKGQTIKEIGKAARAEIGEMAGVPVHLFLFVKVRERWADDPERYREMGLDYPKGRASPRATRLASAGSNSMNASPGPAVESVTPPMESSVPPPVNPGTLSSPPEFGLPACECPAQSCRSISKPSLIKPNFGALPGSPGSATYDPSAALPALDNAGSALAPNPGTSAAGFGSPNTNTGPATSANEACLQRNLCTDPADRAGPF